MQKLKGKWALVTGASRGVGRQIAKGLAGERANLILHSRTAAAAQKVADELKTEGVEIRVVAGELSNPEDVDKIVDNALAASGRLDILYNNAAIMTPATAPFGAPSDDYRKIFEVNTIALIRICNRIIPGMIERGYGRVINLTSGIKDQPDLLPYAVSKAAVDKFVKDLIPAVQGTGVYVNLLDPGWVRTDLGSEKAPDPVESVLPGVLVPALLETEIQGRLFCAQDYKMFVLKA